MKSDNGAFSLEWPEVCWPFLINRKDLGTKRRSMRSQDPCEFTSSVHISHTCTQRKWPMVTFLDWWPVSPDWVEHFQLNLAISINTQIPECTQLLSIQNLLIKKLENLWFSQWSVSHVHFNHQRSCKGGKSCKGLTFLHYQFQLYTPSGNMSCQNLRTAPRISTW
jgi:hypothetical protein